MESVTSDLFAKLKINDWFPVDKLIDYSENYFISNTLYSFEENHIPTRPNSSSP